MTAKSPAELRAWLRDRIDALRVRRGLARLREDTWLDRIAQAHADDMALRRRRFGHGGFVARARVIARAYPGASVGENVAFNVGFRRPARRALRGWLRSRSHRRNLLGSWTWAGIGVAVGGTGRHYFVQIFVAIHRR